MSFPTNFFSLKSARPAIPPRLEQGVFGAPGYIPPREGVPERLRRYKPTAEGKIAAQEYFNQEFGINLEKMKNRSFTTSISNPKKFMEDRATAIDDATEKAATAFQNYLGQLLDVGVPSDKANDAAKAYAKKIYDAELSVYELGHPGFSTAIGSQLVDRNRKVAIRDLLLNDKIANVLYKNEFMRNR